MSGRHETHGADCEAHFLTPSSDPEHYGLAQCSYLGHQPQGAALTRACLPA
jgi:hypothetical protein